MVVNSERSVKWARAHVPGLSSLHVWSGIKSPADAGQRLGNHGELSMRRRGLGPDHGWRNGIQSVGSMLEGLCCRIPVLLSHKKLCLLGSSPFSQPLDLLVCPNHCLHVRNSTRLAGIGCVQRESFGWCSQARFHDQMLPPSVVNHSPSYHVLS